MRLTIDEKLRVQLLAMIQFWADENLDAPNTYADVLGDTPPPTMAELIELKDQLCATEPPPQAINPVTIRGPQGNVTLARLWTQSGMEEINKNFTVALSHGKAEDPSDIIGAVVVDEDKFIESLSHLFPRGEHRG